MYITKHWWYDNNVVSERHSTTKGMSQETPDPLCRAAIVVGPPKEGIQKNPSVSNPFKYKRKNTREIYTKLHHNFQLNTNYHHHNNVKIHYTSFATLESAWYNPIKTGIVAKVGKQPIVQPKVNQTKLINSHYKGYKQIQWHNTRLKKRKTLYLIIVMR